MVSNSIKNPDYLDKDKAMYYNFELDEDEFFDPKILHMVIFDIFKQAFLNDAILQSKNKKWHDTKQIELNGTSIT